MTVSLDGGSTKTVTRTCYTTQSNTCATSETGLSPIRGIENWVSGGAIDDDTNVATDYMYDAQGRMTFETRHVRSTSGATIDDRVTKYVHAANGTLTRQVVNHVDDAVSGGTDLTPASPDWARTDVTTTYTYDSAGNQASVADPRRAIESPAGADDYITRSTYDALGQAITTRQPTTPGGPTCSPDPACRTATTTYDELGGARLMTDSDGTQAGSETDRAGRTVKTHEDPDGAGGTAARQTSLMTLDPQGRTLTSKDDRQLDGSFGQTKLAYDELGRSISAIAADGHADAATTITTYDALDRVTCVQDGWTADPCALATSAGLSTITTYDLGGRVTAVDDEFACTTTTYDYRDLATQVIEGRSAGTCTGAGTRTITQTYDGLGRPATRAVGSVILEGNAYDSAGRVERTWATQGAGLRTTKLTHNRLDQVTDEERYLDTAGTLTERTWSRTNFDAAGNPIDRCTWNASPNERCHPASDTSWANPQPISRSSSTYDARNQRVRLLVPGQGETTYDPSANYQVDKVYVTTKVNGTGQVIAEHVTDHHYDARDRLEGMDQSACMVNPDTHTCTSTPVLTGDTEYLYDDAGNRIKVVEDNGAGAVTRHYCYDARNQLAKVATVAGCGSGVMETYDYDDAGNRTGNGTRSFTYNAAGQLASCATAACGTPTFDADGRLTAITTASGAWTYQYDAEGRLTTACKASSCTGTPARLDMTYDAQGHRIRLVETTAGGSPTITTTDFSYEGDRVVREVSVTGATTVTRTFTTDEAGAIIKLTIVTTGGGSTADDGTYLVTYNGHGDAIGLAEITGTGELDPAARVTYSTWGTPDVDAVGTFGDLKFRYLYVGRYDVQWDDFASAGLLYMHARHYQPEFGRFMQPDPSALEANLYAYAENSPVTKIDPSGEFFWFVAIVVVRIAIAAAPIVVRFAPATTRIAPIIAQGARTASALGIAGERAVRAAYNIGPRVWLNIAGRGRIPDGLTERVLSEVKNVSYQSWTQQLRDYSAYARAHELRFDLYVRSTTKLSQAVIDAARRGDVVIKTIP